MTALPDPCLQHLSFNEQARILRREGPGGLKRRERPRLVDAKKACGCAHGGPACGCAHGGPAGEVAWGRMPASLMRANGARGQGECFLPQVVINALQFTQRPPWSQIRRALSFTLPSLLVFAAPPFSFPLFFFFAPILQLLETARLVVALAANCFDVGQTLRREAADVLAIFAVLEPGTPTGNVVRTALNFAGAGALVVMYDTLVGPARAVLTPISEGEAPSVWELINLGLALAEVSGDPEALAKVQATEAELRHYESVLTDALAPMSAGVNQRMGTFDVQNPVYTGPGKDRPKHGQILPEPPSAGAAPLVVGLPLGLLLFGLGGPGGGMRRSLIAEPGRGQGIASRSKATLQPTSSTSTPAGWCPTVLRAGDTLANLSLAFGVSAETIVRANGVPFRTFEICQWVTQQLTPRGRFLVPVEANTGLPPPGQQHLCAFAAGATILLPCDEVNPGARSSSPPSTPSPSPTVTPPPSSSGDGAAAALGIGLLLLLLGFGGGRASR